MVQNKSTVSRLIRRMVFGALALLVASSPTSSDDATAAEMVPMELSLTGNVGNAVDGYTPVPGICGRFTWIGDISGPTRRVVCDGGPGDLSALKGNVRVQEQMTIGESVTWAIECWSTPIGYLWKNPSNCELSGQYVVSDFSSQHGYGGSVKKLGITL